MVKKPSSRRAGPQPSIPTVQTAHRLGGIDELPIYPLYLFVNHCDLQTNIPPSYAVTVSYPLKEKALCTIEDTTDGALSCYSSEALWRHNLRPGNPGKSRSQIN